MVKYQKVGIMLHIQKDCPSNLIYLVASLIILVFFFSKTVSNLLILSTSLYTIDLDFGFQNIFFKNGFLPTSHMVCIITNYSNLRKIGNFGV